MTDMEQDSTVPRRQLGRYLRQLRVASGVTVKAAAEHLDCSVQKVWRMEKGTTAVRGSDVRELCDCYGADPELVPVLVGLARQTRRRAGGSRTATPSRSGSSCTWAWCRPPP